MAFMSESLVPSLAPDGVGVRIHIESISQHIEEAHQRGKYRKARCWQEVVDGGKSYSLNDEQTDSIVCALFLMHL